MSGCVRVICCAALAVFSTPLDACELALALAVDVSGSVDPDEYRIQMDGLAAALVDPVVSEALVRARARIMVVQWTGSTRQRVTIEWTEISGFDALEDLASRISGDPRVWRNYSTAIGEALDFVAAQFGPVADCKRLLIDLSGDGFSNEGSAPSQARENLRKLGIVVNAIAIEASEPDLSGYFFENVISGEGAFVMSVDSYKDYPARIRKKLLREVTRQSASFRQELPDE
jgi:Ca-activated chloride channel homolog